MSEFTHQGHRFDGSEESIRLLCVMLGDVEKWTISGLPTGATSIEIERYTGDSIALQTGDWLLQDFSMTRSRGKVLAACARDDVLTYQYECGYAAGIREATNNRKAIDNLEPAERDALMATPVYRGQA
jgi:hypothetical protein